MRIIIDNNYCIKQILGNRVANVGDNNFDAVEVAILTSQIESDNCAVRCFSFRLANGHEIGPMTCTNSEDGEYTVFTCPLSAMILSCRGKMQCTATIMFTDDNLLRKPREKNVNCEIEVLDSVVLEETLDVYAKLEELDARVSALEGE